MNTSELDAEARYTPFVESASAVMTPETDLSEMAKDLDHVSRETFTISGSQMRIFIKTSWWDHLPSAREAV